MTDEKTIQVGTKVKFQFNHLFQTVKYTARVIRVNDNGTATVRIPDRVMSLPFPPFGPGKNVATYEISKLQRFAV